MPRSLQSPDALDDLIASLPTTGAPSPPPTAPKPETKRYSIGDLQDSLRQAGWPEDQIVKMSAIGWHEGAQGNPRANRKASGAQNPSGLPEDSVGPWQINWLAHGSRLKKQGISREDLYDPVTNAKVALDLYKDRGYKPWALANQKFHQQYLPMAQKAYSQSDPLDALLKTIPADSAQKVSSTGLQTSPDRKSAVVAQNPNEISVPNQKPQQNALVQSLAVAPPPRELPQQGEMSGKLHLNEKIAPKVPQGSPRPFAPGEWVDNPDGSWSSEISSTIQNPDRSWSVVPGMWLVNGKPQRVDEDTAARYIQQSGLNFPKYKTLDEAEKFATDRESVWQGVKPQDAAKIQPLWSVSSQPKAPPIPKEALAPPPDTSPEMVPIYPRTYDDKSFTGNVGRIMDSGPEAQAAFSQFILKNIPHVKGKAVSPDELMKNEALATTFVNLHDYLANNPKAGPKTQTKAIAQMGMDFLKDPNTKGMQLPKILHEAILSAQWTPDEFKALPGSLKQQISQRHAQMQAARTARTPARDLARDATGGMGGAEEGFAGNPMIPVDRASARRAQDAAENFMRVVNEEKQRTVMPGDPNFFQRLIDRGVSKEDARAVVNLGTGPPTPSILQSSSERAQTQAERDEWERHQIKVRAMANSNALTDQLRDKATQRSTLQRVMRLLNPVTEMEALSEEPKARMFTSGAAAAAGQISNTSADLLHLVDTIGDNIEGNNQVAKLTDKMRDLGAYLQGAADIQAKTPGEAYFKSAGTMAGQAEKFALMKGVTKLPFWAIMGGEAALRTQTQPLAVQAKETALGIVQGVAIEYGPGVVAKVLGKMPGVVGSLARQFPNLIGTGTTAGGFGGLAYEETKRKGGSTAEALGAGAGAATAVAALSTIGGGAKELVEEARQAEATPERLRDILGGRDRALVIDHDGRALSLYGDPKTKGIGGEEISPARAETYAQRGAEEMPVRRVSPEEFDQIKDLVKSKAPKPVENTTKTITGKTEVQSASSIRSDQGESTPAAPTSQRVGVEESGGSDLHREGQVRQPVEPSEVAPSRQEAVQGETKVAPAPVSVSPAGLQTEEPFSPDEQTQIEQDKAHIREMVGPDYDRWLTAGSPERAIAQGMDAREYADIKKRIQAAAATLPTRRSEGAGSQRSLVEAAGEAPVSVAVAIEGRGLSPEVEARYRKAAEKEARDRLAAEQQANPVTQAERRGPDRLTDEEYQAKLRESGVGQGTPPEQLGQIGKPAEAPARPVQGKEPSGLLDAAVGRFSDGTPSSDVRYFLANIPQPVLEKLSAAPENLRSVIGGNIPVRKFIDQALEGLSEAEASKVKSNLGGARQAWKNGDDAYQNMWKAIDDLVAERRAPSDLAARTAQAPTSSAAPKLFFSDGTEVERTGEMRVPDEGEYYLLGKRVMKGSREADPIDPVREILRPKTEAPKTTEGPRPLVGGISPEVAKTHQDELQAKFGIPKPESAETREPDELDKMLAEIPQKGDVTRGRQTEEVQSKALPSAQSSGDAKAVGAETATGASGERPSVRQSGAEPESTGRSSERTGKPGKKEKAGRPTDVNQTSPEFQNWWEGQGPRGRDAVRAYLETGSAGQAVGAWKDAASGVKMNDKQIKAAVNNLIEETDRRLSSEAGAVNFGEIYGVVSNLIQRARDQMTIDPVPGLQRIGVSTQARQHAAARVATPYVVRDILAKVFPDEYANPEAMAQTIDVINKDNILGGYDEFLRLAREASAAQDTDMAQRWQNLADAIGDKQDIARLESDVEAAKQNPQIVANIDRWNHVVNPELDRMYNEMKRVDPDTAREGRGRVFGARVNLLPESRAAEMKNFGDLNKPMPEAGSSSYRNPNVKKDKFMRLARFTGQYSTDAEAVLTNVIGPRWNEVTKLRLFDGLTDSGAAVEMDYGEVPPAKIQGHKVARLPIKVPETSSESGLTRMVEKVLYVRGDLVGEIRAVLGTDMPLPNSAMAKFLTTIQLAQLTDMTAHLKNIHTVLASAPATRSAFTDALRRLPIIGTVDTVARVTNVVREVIADTPTIRAEIAEMAKLGLIRPKYPLTGIQKATRGQQVIHHVDTASRIVMNRFFDNLVEAGRVKDTEENRASFVQQIGEYNRRLMGPWMRAMKDKGWAPFIVAGRNFNRQARRLLTGNPGVEVSTLGESAKMRLVNILSGLVAASVLPALLNLLTTNHLGGRPGTPIGAWDLGKPEDERGRHRVIDLMQIVGIRRGLRGTGVGALVEGLREGQTWDEIIGRAVQDVASTVTHPWMGPALGFGYQTVTGKRLDLRGGPEAPEALNVGGGGKQYIENARTALENQNPLLAGALSPLTAPVEPEDSYPTRLWKGFIKGPTSAAGVYDLQSPAQKILSEDRRRRGAFSRTVSQAETMQIKDKLHEDERAGKNISSSLEQAVADGKLTLRQAHDFHTNQGMSPLALQIKYAPLNDATIRAFEVMTDEQKDDTRVTMALKLEGAKPEFFTDDMRTRLEKDGFTIPAKIGSQRKVSESRRETQKTRKETKAVKRWLPPETRPTPNPNRRYQVTPR